MPDRLLPRREGTRPIVGTILVGLAFVVFIVLLTLAASGP